MTDAGPLGGTRDVAEIERRLASETVVPDARAARAVRDLAAEHLGADPAISVRLSQALFGAVSRSPGGDDAAFAIAWRCRAEAQLYTGHPLDARRAYEEATAAAERASALHELGQILVGRVGLLNLLGETRDASVLATRAERVLHETGDRAYLAKLHQNQGNAHYDAERYEDAHRAYQEAYKIMQADGAGGAAWASLVMSLGVACTNLGRLDGAHRLLSESETHAAEHGLDLIAAHARFNRAFLERLRGNYRDALALLESSRVVFLRHDTGSLPASVDRAMAGIYLDLSMPGDALVPAQRARRAYTEHQMMLDARLAEMDEARALIDTGHAPEAIRELERIEAYFEADGMTARRAVAQLHASRAHASLGDTRRARELARKAARAFDASGMAAWSSRARRAVARTYLSEGRTRESDEVLRVNARGARALPVRERLSLAALRGHVALLRDDRSLARRQLRRASELLEAHRRLIPGIELRARALADHAGVYRDLVRLELSSRTPRFDALLGLTETARARAFRERTHLGAAPADVELASRRARLGQLAQELEQAELSGEASGERRRALRSEIRALEAHILAHDRRRQALDARTPERFGAVSSDAVMRALGPGESLVTYFIVGETVLALVLTHLASGTRVRRHMELDVGAAALSRLVERMRFQLDAMALGAGRDEGNLAFKRRVADGLLGELHRAILEPLEPFLAPDGRLHVVPHGILHRVPFEALHDGTRYASERWTLLRTPSADQLAHPADPAAGGDGVVLAGAVSALESVGSELEEAAAALAASAPVIVRDPTTAQLLAHIETARLLHISTHGTFREDNPLFSRLATADGAVFLGDVVERRVPATLVVLSACQAGLASTGQGDDLAGLAHGFLAAGARCLIASQWRVHDRATAALMAAFYHRYAGDAQHDAARALALASRDVRARWDHPFYWASFSVHGH